MGGQRNWEEVEGCHGNDPSRGVRRHQGSVRRIAVTESSDAFSSGRKDAAKQVLGKELVRVWDAMLHACPKCKEADGTIVSIREMLLQPGRARQRSPALQVLLDVVHVGGDEMNYPHPSLPSAGDLAFLKEKANRAVLAAKLLRRHDTHEILSVERLN